MRVSDVMTDKPRYVNFATSVADAARIMREDDIGFVPVEKDDKMVGMLTDRDITVRVVADDQNPSTVTAEKAMTPDVEWVFDDQDADQASRLMQKMQVRRLPVVNHDKRLVGVVSLGDLATEVGGQEKTLEEVSSD
jgi:CBS domain-containing protein